ncbi:unnamed protein product [Acanthoscelides obtectus]|uniref:Uncharacterized protein n=1 Tax=Acanthoscelides obtectus TaxID=200917 RepID=A0A9P0QGD4_ACAOB|nr:unnamed protein product [Acanthoscelides obtectus]CAH2017841.1 unnamed protein product [Acanthoscelides obtectus]CAH2019591.1 unnamed protein product [Acanthoscelides obtectus]CAK1687173.1 hypothetical protein AOBTE_LOCUS36203 [Acanthoscelides obtectus]CAK1687179.1 hypothetical protein AOBTE_LOCUS36206 [Acanthoscelides obtectus]
MMYDMKCFLVEQLEKRINCINSSTLSGKYLRSSDSQVIYKNTHHQLSKQGLGGCNEAAIPIWCPRS